MRNATDGLADDLLLQRDFLREREPVYARLLELLVAELPVLAPSLERIWGARTFFARYDRPLLLLASLRHDALREGPAHPLWASVGDVGGARAEPEEGALRAATAQDRERFWTAAATRAVQTNETTRAVAWLWPASLIARVDAETPLHLVDVGCSAGLNLVSDDPRLAGEWVDQEGGRLSTRPLPPIGTRLGLDLAPLDVLEEGAACWLRACVWPSDAARLERLDRSIEAFRRAVRGPRPPRLEACHIEHVPDRAATVGEGGRLIVLQTIMRDYLSPEQRATYEQGLRDLILSRPAGAVLWVELEVEGDLAVPDRSAVLRVKLADGGRVVAFVLARTHPHPRKLFVESDQVEALGRALA